MKLRGWLAPALLLVGGLLCPARSSQSAAPAAPRTRLVVSPRVGRDVRSLADLTRELSRRNLTVFCGAQRSATREMALALLGHATEAAAGEAAAAQQAHPARRAGRFVEAADALPSTQG